MSRFSCNGIHFILGGCVVAAMHKTTDGPGHDYPDTAPQRCLAVDRCRLRLCRSSWGRMTWGVRGSHFPWSRTQVWSLTNSELHQQWNLPYHKDEFIKTILKAHLKDYPGLSKSTIKNNRAWSREYDQFYPSFLQTPHQGLCLLLQQCSGSLTADLTVSLYLHSSWSITGGEDDGP